MSITYFTPDCYFDTDKRSLFVKNESVHLTEKELLVLEYLLAQDNALTPTEDIFQNCWGVSDVDMDYYPKDSIKNSVKSILKNLKRKAPLAGLISPVPNVGYKLVVPNDLNQKVSRAGHILEDPFLFAMEEYRAYWANMDMIFIQIPQARAVKRYFYTHRKELPPPEQMEMGLAVAELLRDTISYSEVILTVLPESLRENYAEDHFRYKNMILQSRLCMESMRQFRFSSESLFNLERTTLQNYGPLDLKAMVSFSKIFIAIDTLFIRSPDILALRKYFYQSREALPDGDQLSLATSVCEYIKDQMQYSEILLPYIPQEYEMSYLRYRDWILSSRLMEESKKEYTFPWETRL